MSNIKNSHFAYRSVYFKIMPVKFTERSYAYTMLILSVVIWGIATPVIKSTVDIVPPLTFLMLRFWASSVVTIPLGIYYFKKVKLNGERIKKILTASSIGHILSLSLIFIGLSLTSSSDGSIITSISPLIVTLMGFFILREHITRKEIEGTLLAFVGTMIIIFEPLIFHAERFDIAKPAFIGNIIFFLGMVADGYYSIYVKKNLAEDKLVTPLMQIVFSFIFAAIVFTPIAVAEQYYHYTKTESGTLRMCSAKDIDRYNYSTGTICDQKGCFPTKQKYSYFCLTDKYRTPFSTYVTNEVETYTTGIAVLVIIYMAFFSGIIAYAAYNTGLKYIEASEASVFYYLQPVFSIPVSILLLGESVNLMFAVGAAVIVTGIYLVERR